MNVGLYINLDRDRDGSVSSEFMHYLESRGIEYRLIERDITIFADEEYYTRHEVLDWAELIVVFGGDGTMLSIAVDASKHNVPLLGINVGHLGFLSEISPDKMCEAMDSIMAGNYHEDTRDLLKVSYNDDTMYALNEVILNRDNTSRIMRVDVYIDDILADTIMADGVMVATPTGSTAYSLACGGPILSPNVKAFVVNSICPHSLNTRPIVVSQDSKVSLECIRSDMNKGHLVLDGKVVATLTDEHRIIIEKSEYSVKFLRLRETNFYNRLLSKMNTWVK